MFNKNLANSYLKSTASSTVRHSAIRCSKNSAAASGNIKTTTINNFDNLTSVHNNGLSKQFLLKKQLHLNLNGEDNDNSKQTKKYLKKILHSEHEEIGSSAAAICNIGFIYYRNDVYDKEINNEEWRRNRGQYIEDDITVTLEPKLLQKSPPLSSTSTTLLKSSPTALAKFNRIIDATVPIRNKYQPKSQLQQQQIPHTATPMALGTRLALAYRNTASKDSITIKPVRMESIEISNNDNKSKRTVNKEVEEKGNLISKTKIDENQVERNDVHYLLKQLNSFSDIEKIEIVNMNQKHLRQKQQRDDANEERENRKHNTEKNSLTRRSLELISPSSLSHNQTSSYQTQQKFPTMVASSISQQQIPSAAAAVQYHNNNAMYQQLDQEVGWQPFEDYIFQSCHYLETNHFAANYHTTMVESSSHEFRPSYSSVHEFDLCETEPPSVECKTSLLPQQHIPNSEITQPQDYHYSCTTVHAQQPPVLGPPARRFQLQTRLTSSGVQTELTPSSLSTSETNSNANNYSNNNSSSCRNRHATSVNSSEVVLCRRTPIFKCCYTAIDRWCERRHAASEAAKQKQINTTAGIGADGSPI